MLNALTLADKLTAIYLAALFTLILTGCGAGALNTTIEAANTLGGIASAAGEHVNADFKKDDHACLFAETGAAVTTSLDEQAACLARIRTAYDPALRAYDDFVIAWTAVAAVIHDAQSIEALGGTPSLLDLAPLLPELYRTADALTAVYRLLSPSLAPIPATAPGAAPTSTAAPIAKGSP